jgi:hypothetical protein
MPSKPGKDETEQEFMSRCMSVMSKEGKHPKDQQAAICFSMWREAHPKSKEAKNPKAAMMMSPEDMKKSIDGMSEEQCITMMKRMGKYKQGMSIGEMKSALKSMANNPELHNKMMGK